MTPVDPGLWLALFLAMTVLGIGVAHIIPWLTGAIARDRTRRELAAAVAAAAERHPCGFCDDLTEMGDYLCCTCPDPCGKSWCTALRRARRMAELGRPE